MATVLKLFQKQSLPTRNAVRREVNIAVQKVLEEERNEACGRKQKYTHFTPEDRAKIAKYAAQCGNTAAVSMELCVVGLWRQESVKQWTNLRVTQSQRMTLC